MTYFPRGPAFPSGSSLIVKVPLGGDCAMGPRGREGAGRLVSSGPGVKCILTSEKKHCLLELGARGVRELVQNEIYPIVIHVEVTEKNVREVR